MNFKFVLWWLLLFFSSMVQAQSTSGTEFWTSFLPNADPNTSYDYYFSLTFASKEPAVVEVSNEKLGYSKTITLNANSVEVIRLPRQMFDAQEFGKILNNSIHITSSTPISVYAENFIWYSNDATLVLPVSACGSYYIAQSNIGRITSAVETNGEYQPSTMSVIAFEDNTEVQIVPSQTLTTGQAANIPFTITLNKGEFYQCATMVSNNGRGLSGTTVLAIGGKKVAVYTGNRCCTVPDVDSPGDSDMLFDVDFPVSSWGNRFVVHPFKEGGYDMIRCTACKDGTSIYKNGVLLATINALDSYEFVVKETDGPFSVVTSEPVALYQYMTGNAYISLRYDGGPSFQYVAPIEQALDEVTFTTNTNPMVRKHYVNLVVKTEDVPSVTLDGATGFTSFTAVDDVYSAAAVKLSTGVHTIKAKSGFIANAYGVGQNVSYSYAVGAKIQIKGDDINASICQGEVFRLGTDVYGQPGEYYWKGISSQGCDSVVKLNLVVLPTHNTIINDTVCLGSDYHDYGFDLPEQTVLGMHGHELYFKNEFGCDSLVSLLLTVVKKPDNSMIPTVFTPYHRNGINDIFMHGYEVYIYDRYGNLICHSTNGWNGYYRGEIADAGVYVYTVFMKDGTKKRGTIEIYK